VYPDWRARATRRRRSNQVLTRYLSRSPKKIYNESDFDMINQLIERAVDMTASE